jgi:hypothetical protein
LDFAESLSGGKRGRDDGDLTLNSKISIQPEALFAHNLHISLDKKTDHIANKHPDKEEKQILNFIQGQAETQLDILNNRKTHDKPFNSLFRFSFNFLSLERAKHIGK